MIKTNDAGSEQFVMSKEQELQRVEEEWHSGWDKGHENKKPEVPWGKVKEMFIRE